MQDSNPSGSQTLNRQQTECPLTNRLSYRRSSKNLNSTARPYDQRAFSPLDPTAVWHSHLALAIYMFVVVNFDALAQASDIINKDIIGSHNGLSPVHRQAIISTNVGLLLIGPLGTNFSEILIKLQQISWNENPFENFVCKMAATLSRPQRVENADSSSTRS